MCKREWTTPCCLSVSQAVLALSWRAEAKCSDTPHATSKAARGWLWKDLGQQWLSSFLAQMGIETAFLPL